ncbi:MAG: hypothetical protein IJT94_01735 [Oscillibacter sp.]|nr:hypothetical protein [Oscillibacter sp.]
MHSQVADWLCRQPEIRQKIFEMAKDRKVIVYDKASGTWRGVGYAD